MSLGRPVLRRCVQALACTFVLAAAAPALGATTASDPCTSTQTSQLDVSITVWQPGPNTSPADAHECTPSAGATLTGTWNLRLDALSLSSLKSFSVSIAPADSSIPPLPASATMSRTYPLILVGDGKIADTIRMPLDAGALRYNGAYQISATAVSMLNSVAQAQVGNLLVSNPPAQPSGPSARLDGTVPVLTWTANPEPDVTGYRILRSAGGGAYTTAGTSTTNSFRDAKAPQDKPVTYEVVAVRKSPVSPGGIASAPSVPSAALAAAAAGGAAAPAAGPAVKPPAAAGNGAPAQDPSSTFAPTLPFAQAVPTETASLPAPKPTAAAALPGEGGAYTKTTLGQKLPFLGAALGIVLVAFLVFQYARRLRRGEA